MRILRSLCLVFLSSIVIGSYSPVNAQTLDFTKLVNPFTGTGDHGHTYPASENSGWDFSGIRNKARNQWNQYLSKIEIEDMPMTTGASLNLSTKWRLM